MRLVNAYWYNVHEDWTYIINKNDEWKIDTYPEKSAWLLENCPNGSDDFVVWAYNNDTSATIYFFRDPHVASMFALKWG